MNSQKSWKLELPKQHFYEQKMSKMLVADKYRHLSFVLLMSQQLLYKEIYINQIFQSTLMDISLGTQQLDFI